MIEINYKPIGIIRSPFKEMNGTPIQPESGRNIEASVQVFPDYVAGLKDLDGFSHIILIYHLHLCKGWQLLLTPYMADKERGLFATRAPARPNPIGISVVRLIKIERDTIYFRDVDVIDRTPLLDIKPHFATLDMPKPEKMGWLENNIQNLNEVVADSRFE